MTDRRMLLEADLRELASDLEAAVGGRDVSGVVSARLMGMRRRARIHRTLAVVLVAALTLGVVPPARAAVVRIVELGADTIHQGSPPPARRAMASANLAGLGAQVDLEWARRRLPVVVPTLPGLGAPDSVWLSERGDGQVSLLYTHEGVLVQEFLGNGHQTVEKYVEFDRHAHPAKVGRYDAVFIDGPQHVVWYRDLSETQLTEYGRLVGNALVMQRGPLTIRIEGDRTRERMTTIAASLR